MLSNSPLDIIKKVELNIRSKLEEYLDEYVGGTDIRNKLKKGIFTMEPRIKKYSINSNFPLHCDASTISAETRKFAYILYLNDNFEGGNTIFHSGTKIISEIKPKRGNLLIFPVHSIYTHEGAKILNGNKYIYNGFVGIFQSSSRIEIQDAEGRKIPGGPNLDKAAVLEEINMYNLRLLQIADKLERI